MAKGFKDKDKKFHPTEKNNKGISSKDLSNNPNDKKPSKVNPEGADDIKRKKAIKENAEEHDLEESVVKKLQELEGDDVFVEDVKSKGSGFGHGDLITLDNGDEYILFDSNDDLRKEAEDAVTQDLEEEPEIFNKDFIDSHSEISDTDARLLGVDFGDSLVEDRDLDELKEMAERLSVDFEDPDDLEDEIEEKPQAFGLTKEDVRDETEKYNEVLEDAREKAEEKLESQLIDDVSSARADEVEETIKRNGLRSFIVDDEGLASDEEFMDQYGRFLVLNIEEAVDDAIATYGAEHFISRVDGQSHEVKSGEVLVKES